jgi:hypothetical protein
LPVCASFRAWRHQVIEVEQRRRHQTLEFLASARSRHSSGTGSPRSRRGTGRRFLRLIRRQNREGTVGLSHLPTRRFRNEELTAGGGDAHRRTRARASSGAAPRRPGSSAPLPLGERQQPARAAGA